MKTSVISVHDMLSVLSVSGVEKRIGDVPGVESVTVNFAAGNATVRYDETRLDVADIKSAVRQRGYEPAAPAIPNAVPVAPATADSASAAIAQPAHVAADAQSSTSVPAVPSRAWRVMPALALVVIAAVVWLALVKPF